MPYVPGSKLFDGCQLASLSDKMKSAFSMQNCWIISNFNSSIHHLHYYLAFLHLGQVDQLGYYRRPTMLYPLSSCGAFHHVVSILLPLCILWILIMCLSVNLLSYTFFWQYTAQPQTTVAATNSAVTEYTPAPMRTFRTSRQMCSVQLCQQSSCRLDSASIKRFWWLNAVAISMASGRAVKGDDVGSADPGTKLLTSPRSCCFQCYIWWQRDSFCRRLVIRLVDHCVLRQCDRMDSWLH